MKRLSRNEDELVYCSYYQRKRELFADPTAVATLDDFARTVAIHASGRRRRFGFNVTRVRLVNFVVRTLRTI